eukprot:3929842-Rhodomonas_salina.1
MAAAAAAAAAVFVHPISDRDVAKIHCPKHDGSDTTWQSFAYEVEDYADDIDAGYVLEMGGNLIDVLGHVPVEPVPGPSDVSQRLGVRIHGPQCRGK